MKDKIQSFQISTIIYFIMRASYIGIAINSYLHFAKTDSYLCILIGNIIGILPLLLTIKISEINKEKNINEIIRNIFGKKIGNIISLILATFIFYFATILFYDLINFIASEYLYKTPSLLIGIMMILPVIYILTKGLKTIFRTSIMLFIISMILFIISIVGTMPNFSTSNLFPFLEFGITGPIKGSICYVAYSILPIFTLTIIPRKQVGIKKGHVFLTSLFVGGIIFLSMLTVIGVLGTPLALIYQYPDYQLLRRIQVGGFIQRTESVLAIQWFLCLFMSISFYLYYAIDTFKYIFKKKDMKLANYLLPILLLIVSRNLFSNNTQFVTFQTKELPILLLVFLLAIPILIYITYKVKKKCS
jgi:spore germination protein KB